MDINVIKARSSNNILGLLIAFQLAMLIVIGILLVQLLTHQTLPFTTIFSSVFLILICLPLSLFLYVTAPDRVQKKVFLSFAVSFGIMIISGIIWDILPMAFPGVSMVPLAKSLTVLAYLPFIVALVSVLRTEPVNVPPHVTALIVIANVSAVAIIMLLVAIRVSGNGLNALDAAIYSSSTIADIVIFSICSILALNFMQNQLRYVFMIMLIFFLLGLAGDSLSLLGALGWQGLTGNVQLIWDTMFILTAISLIVFTLNRNMKVTTVEEVNRTLHDTRRLMGDLIMQSPEAIGIFDAGGDLIMANPAFEQMAVRGMEKATGKTNLFRDSDTLFGAGTEIAGIRKGGTVQLEVAGAPGPSDRPGSYYHMKASPAHDAEGKITGFIVLLVDITDRKRYEEALVRAKNQAELYLDLMGHDINNMNQIGIGFLEMALGHIRFDNEGQMLVRKPLEAMRNSSHLIDNVKKIRRADTESSCLGPVDLGKTLDEVVQEYRGLPGRDVMIEYVPVDECYVLANPLLKDIFANLINNAFKHAGGPVKIWVKVSPVGGVRPAFYRVTVEDNGPGIPENARQVLLEPAHSYKNRAGGRGLGLYLVRVLVDSFKGTISVEDRVPGDARPGTCITVTLPAADGLPGASMPQYCITPEGSL